MTEGDTFLVIVLICVAISVGVWALFLLGHLLNVPWYVSAVAILLIGRFLMVYLAGG